jgi:hypothetical protein
VSKFSNSPCRNCGHYHWYSDFFLKVGTCVHFPPYEMSNCGCKSKDYVPKDNLEYLEYCLENKK